MKQYRLAELAELLQATLIGDPECIVSNMNVIHNAQAGDIVFLINSRYKKYLSETKASAVIVSSKHADLCNTNALVVDDPHLGYAKVASLFQQVSSMPEGVHSSSSVGENCDISASAAISANCSIGNHVTIKDNVVIHPGTVIADHVTIGANSLIYPNVTIYRDVIIGDNAIIHSGVVIGSDGFSFAQHQGTWQKVPQIGSVEIGHDVEIGANTTIDCGAIENTIIGDGVKLDNLIQIGHNVNIGEHSIIAGCVGIAGSAVIGKRCFIGGASGIAGHLTITDDVMLAAKSQVNTSITTPGIYSSAIKAQPIEKWRKNVARFGSLDDMARRVKSLEKTLKQIGK